MLYNDCTDIAFEMEALSKKRTSKIYIYMQMTCPSGADGLISAIPLMLSPWQKRTTISVNVSSVFYNMMRKHFGCYI